MMINVKGVHTLTDEIKKILLEKHPKSREVINEEILIQTTAQPPEQIIFEVITSNQVQRVAKGMKGSGGPTQVDADI